MGTFFLSEKLWKKGSRCAGGGHLTNWFNQLVRKGAEIELNQLIFPLKLDQLVHKEKSVLVHLTTNKTLVQHNSDISLEDQGQGTKTGTPKKLRKGVKDECKQGNNRTKSTWKMLVGRVKEVTGNGMKEINTEPILIRGNII